MGGREAWQRDGGPRATGTSARPSSLLRFSRLAHWQQQQCARRLSCLLVAVLTPFWLILWLIIASCAISLTFSRIRFCLLVLLHGNSKELSSGQTRRVGQTYWNSWGGGVKEALLCDITVVVILGVEDVTDGDWLVCFLFCCYWGPIPILISNQWEWSIFRTNTFKVKMKILVWNYCHLDKR